MRHFSPEEWVDYARGLPENVPAGDMRLHLEEGCQQCSGVLRRQTAVLQAFAAPAVRVPEQVVARAYAIFPTRRFNPAEGPLKLVARLLFDGWSRPALEGVRASMDGTRQLSFRAGDLRVELSLEVEGKSRKLTVTGQLHSESNSAAGRSIRLMAGDRALVSTVTNEFGEFTLKAGHQDHMHLAIEGSDKGSQIALPLPQMAAINLPIQTLKRAKSKQNQ